MALKSAGPLPVFCLMVVRYAWYDITAVFIGFSYYKTNLHRSCHPHQVHKRQFKAIRDYRAQKKRATTMGYPLYHHSLTKIIRQLGL
jgi:beta-glucosidase/6-phospho-beta-glucosidase/beta-galactosidase